ncbi:MAG: amidohydrolase family protein [Thermoplasmata archaeon]|nr:amidohydrolase family protein [Thermoplasmata archaeon]
MAGRAWLRGRLQPIEVGVGEGGRIVAVKKSVTGERRRDLGDAVLMPSATDLHVHFRDPGGPDEVEDFASGTRQAALGGVGLVADMPNTRPLMDRLSRLESKVARTRGRLAVDAALLASAQRAGRIPILAAGSAGFKLYLSPSTNVEATPDETELGPILESVARSGLSLTVHAEDPALFSELDPATTSAGWDAHRPARAEAAAITRLVAAVPAGLRLDVAHVTTVDALRAVVQAGHASEATAHHLLLAASSSTDARRKVNPPLRPEVERAKLWEAFRAGEIPFLASDHAPHSAAAKDQPYALAPSGMPGVETTVPLLLARVRQSELAFATLQAAACDRPARWLGQPEGRLAVGHDANFLVVDFRKRRRLHARDLHAPCGWTAFEGWEAIFPREHYLRGERIVEGGEYVGRPIGRLVRPEYVDRALVPSSPGSERR